MDIKECENEKENIILIEELLLEIKNITENNIIELIPEEINENKDKETKFIEKNFTYNKVLNFHRDNIYDFLFFWEIYKRMTKEKIRNIDR